MKREDSRELGRNMADIKRTNREAILNAIYHRGGMSRKEIAKGVGLTPAAITLLTSEMIEEGLLEEKGTEFNSSRVGRKEIILGIHEMKYAAFGVYVAKEEVSIGCYKLNREVIFERKQPIVEFKRRSELILNCIRDIIRECIEEFDILERYRVVGMGVAVRGVVDEENGISIHSYHVWERNVEVKRYFEEAFDFPIVIVNNVCSVGFGEVFGSENGGDGNTVLVKYGPGVGAAVLFTANKYQTLGYRQMELGHLIVESNGKICSCGNRGCLETIVGFEAILDNVRYVYSKSITPILYQLTDGDSLRIDIESALESYHAGEPLVVEIFERAAYFFALALKNVITLNDPERIVMYGRLMEDTKFWGLFEHQLLKFVGGEGVRQVTVSKYNLQLETKGPAAVAISHFFANGGSVQWKRLDAGLSVRES